jgi:D-alanyl-D-alanine carboxypeptidase
MINRRIFVAMFGGLAASLLTVGGSWQKPDAVSDNKVELVGPPLPPIEPGKPDVKNVQLAQISDHHPDHIIADNIAPPVQNKAIKPLSDIILRDADKVTFETVIARLARVQDYVGYGKFNVIGWDQSLRIARNRDQIGSFTKAELDFIEELFFTNASSFGFYGDKVITELSATIEKSDIVKIPGTGHYLFKGIAAETYQKIRRDVGTTITLTSGIRSVVKQLHLFLDKANRTDGNLSLASYSLAPPGHSYHALGDFDVGKTGFGKKNFSEEFARTEEFKRLSDLGYLDIRYPQNNPYGVRYEPWHIKVV